MNVSLPGQNSSLEAEDPDGSSTDIVHCVTIHPVSYRIVPSKYRTSALPLQGYTLYCQVISIWMQFYRCTVVKMYLHLCYII